MESEFWPVAWVTLAVLGAITAAMVSFEAIGIAEVRKHEWKPCVGTFSFFPHKT